MKWSTKIFLRDATLNEKLSPENQINVAFMRFPRANAKYTKYQSYTVERNCLFVRLFDLQNVLIYFENTYYKKHLLHQFD